MRQSASAVKIKIERAFSDLRYPGDWCLVGSKEGSEPDLVERDFKGKTDWRTLEAKFIDGAPDGLASALSFFSYEAFRFYLPAYLIADVDGLLKQADPTYDLTHGFNDESRKEKINPIRYGERTWRDHAAHRCSVFSAAQADAIATYLEFKSANAPACEKNIIDQALADYWLKRAAV